MDILLTKKEVVKAISDFYKISENMVEIDEDNNYNISLPDNAQLTIFVPKNK